MGRGRGLWAESCTSGLNAQATSRPSHPATAGRVLRDSLYLAFSEVRRKFLSRFPVAPGTWHVPNKAKFPFRAVSCPLPPSGGTGGGASAHSVPPTWLCSSLLCLGSPPSHFLGDQVRCPCLPSA